MDALASKDKDDGRGSGEQMMDGGISNAAAGAGGGAGGDSPGEDPEESMMEEDDDDDKKDGVLSMDTTSSMMTDEDNDVAIASGMNTEEDDDGDDDDAIGDAQNLPSADDKTMKDDVVDGDVDGNADEVMEGGGSTPDKKNKVLSASSSPAGTTFPNLDMALHDWLSLGEIERGLDTCRNNGSRGGGRHGHGDGDDERIRSSEELERLPFLLRILNQTRPLADIRSVVGTTSTDTATSGMPSPPSPPSSSSSLMNKDPLIDKVVDRLEDVGATYSAAEGVDVVGNYLTPALCKKISRLTVPVRKRRRTDIMIEQFKKKLQQQQQNTMNDGDAAADGATAKRFEVPGYDYYYYQNEWDVKELEDVAQDPLHQPKKRKHAVLEGGGDDAAVASEVLVSEDSDGEDGGDPGTVEASGTAVPSPSSSFRRRDSVEMAGEDSQESTVLKTLSEVASLVASSLNVIDCNHNDGSQSKPQGDPEEAGEQPKDSQRDAGSSLGLTIEDSILSEKAGGYDDTVSNGVKSTTLHGSDLGSTLASIMHYSPVIQSRHVATAICRASLPQSEFLLKRIAANSPTMVPSLLLGCIDAYIMAMDQGNISITRISKKAVSSLAKLSLNEAVTVRSKLQSLGIMYDVQLRLSIDSGNFVDVAAMLIHHLLPLSSSTAKVKLETQLHGHQGYLMESPPSKNIEGGPMAEPTLLDHFSRTPALLDSTVKSFSNVFRKATNEGNQSTGFWSLTMQAFSLLMLTPAMIEDTPVLIDNLNGLVEWFDYMEVGRSHSDFDGFVIASAFLLASRNMNENTESHEIADVVSNLMNTTSKIGCRDTSTEIWQCLDNLVAMGCTQGLFIQLCGLVANDDDFSPQQEVIDNQSYRLIQNGLKGLCENTRPDNNTPSSTVGLPVKISFLLLALCNSLDNTSIYDDSKDVLKLLVGPHGSTLVPINEIHFTRAAQFVSESTILLSRAGLMQVPLVMQSDLEFSLLTIEASNSDGCNDLNCFMLRFHHALEFCQSNPTSPFAIDPYTSLIGESILLVERLPSGPAKSFLMMRIWEILDNLGVATTWWGGNQYSGTRVSSLPYSSMSRGQLKMALADAIRTEIRGEDAENGEGRIAELLFFVGKSRLVDADLYTSVLSSLLTSGSDPPKVFSFDALCRDPMIIFKAPVAVWKCRGLRRIALSTLNVLMKVSDCLVMHTSRSQESSTEFLAARDAMILRCLLASISKTDVDRSSTVCSSLSGFVRFLVANRPGIVAILLKQGLDETDLDWLIENVPEVMMNDANDCLSMLSERSTLTAAERLVAADAIIRISIVHGNVNEQEATNMLVAALSRLIDSFYLILGPIGDIPVNSVLAADDSSADTVQVARKAAFRILKALARLRGTRTRMKKEAGTALQKLASLCKAESTSSSRRKLLNQIFDATSRAAASLGIALGPQVAVAVP